MFPGDGMKAATSNDGREPPPLGARGTEPRRPEARAAAAANIAGEPPPLRRRPRSGCDCPPGEPTPRWPAAWRRPGGGAGTVEGRGGGDVRPRSPGCGGSGPGASTPSVQGGGATPDDESAIGTQPGRRHGRVVHPKRRRGEPEHHRLGAPDRRRSAPKPAAVGDDGRI
ncbi:unnamed protein product [Urochloa humidicola]